MKKIGEMSIQELKEALKEILKSKEKKGEESSSDGFFKEFYFGIKDFFIFIAELLSFKALKRFFSEKLTKEVFIRRGIKVKNFLSETVQTIVFVLVAIIIIKGIFFEIRWIPSASMHPTLIEGDRVLVNVFSKYTNNYKRGDIMIFYPPGETLENTPSKVFSRLTGIFCKDIAYIKRIVGLPGEKLEIKRDSMGVNRVYINDEPLEEDYIKNPLDFPDCNENMYCGPLYLGEDEYFMMGDNRGNSQDSRYWGVLKRDRFIGKATLVLRLSKLK